MAAAFPLPLLRKTHHTFERKLKTYHFNLVVDKGEPTEHITFYGDWMSFTGSLSLEFYKSWEQQVKLCS